MNSGLFGFWLRFGSVTGFFKPAPSPKPRQTPKILAAHRYIFSVNALDNENSNRDLCRSKFFGELEERMSMNIVGQCLVSNAYNEQQFSFL
jgi:hypothetical protein